MWSIYLITAIIIILVLILLAQIYKRAFYKYKEDAKIAVKTSRGLIKMNAATLAAELDRIKKGMDQHKNKQRTTKFNKQIDAVIAQLQNFIEKNPNNKDLCKIEAQVSIVDRAMQDAVSPDASNYYRAFNTLRTDDELEYGTDSMRFDYLLNNVEILLRLLRNDICDNGYIDLVALENILRAVDEDLTNQAVEFHSENLSDDAKWAFASKYNTNVLPRQMSLFESFATQPMAESRIDINRGIPLPVKPSKSFILGPQYMRDQVQRSQMLAANHEILGKGLGGMVYNDEDLLHGMSYEKYSV